MISASESLLDLSVEPSGLFIGFDFVLARVEFGYSIDVTIVLDSIDPFDNLFSTELESTFLEILDPDVPPKLSLIKYYDSIYSSIQSRLS